MEKDVEILLVCEDEQIKGQLSNQSFAININFRMVTSYEARKEIERALPDIVIIFDSEKYSGIEIVQNMHKDGRENYSPLIIYTAYKQNFILFRELIRIGIDDYFILPDEMINLNERLTKIIHVLKEQKTSKSEAVATSNALKKGRGQIHAFFSGKGGVGCSLLSTLFGQTMKFESTADVLFIDLNLQYGGAEKYLGIESGRSLADLLPVMDELTENHIHSVVVKEPFSTLDLLLSPQDAEVAEKITDEQIIRLLRTCRRAYDIVILDLPSNMDSITYTALDESDYINYVMSLDTPCISNYKKVMDLFNLLRIDTKGRLQIVVNRLERNNELKPADIKEFVSAPIVAKINEDKKSIHPLINKGEPLRKEVKEKKLPSASKDVRKWVLSQLK